MNFSFDVNYEETAHLEIDFISQESLGFMATSEAAKVVIRDGIIQAGRVAEEGKPAPNPEVLELTTKKFVKLLDFQKEGRPLLINFGSCT